MSGVGDLDVDAAAVRWSPPSRGTHTEASGEPFGHVLRRLRLQAGLSQAELARRIGSTQPGIARLESDRQAPTLSTLNRLAAAFGRDLVVRVPCRTEDDGEGTS